ncbi:glycoside hydrolase family 3 C-terminal domain-containing protein [Streptomyces sp. NBC_01022]|uniref:glycoside hydrolase family 3 C-terminal domain-containing protein n=1 Tax=Streptomyces sp. NBC_01022 TaxID=2903723 RepID=UPI002DDAB506|nr:glycoside hydrolase family 3 C-terminal domain-containing protein [Streptomyces sp. NBC_01022]WRZ79366.1 glycoside hydrolase family 3 C-terminal domain-containing protein [Streptomyces sp. NBC_01022]WRZ86310.1 glycoside hydrolase family 3 C-terminal domain-containing protein [Streptomyces sp. NBC_01022]
MTDEEIDPLLEKLDAAQKVRLLTGASTWRTHAEPALGLRALTLSDGPAGVRGETWDERVTSLVLPSPTALAASWDERLLTDLGVLLAAEARRKGVDVLLAPTLNLHRSPLGGRHFECFSEDPFLTGRTGAALIKGIQSGGVAATAKHFVANDAETDRLNVDVRVDEQTLHEVYLAPFEAAVAAGVHAVMSAYNKVRGITMSASPLLDHPLKKGWGFEGPVISDWGGVRTLLDTARSAQDLAMPGPDGPWAAGLLTALEQGLVSPEAIDDKVRRLLRLAGQVGALGSSRPVRRPVIAPGTQRTLLRRAVAAGSVLLRNDGELLPLDPAGLRSVAVIGPHATAVRIQGGGSAEVFPDAVATPLAGIEAALEGSASVSYHRGLPPSARPVPLTREASRDPRTGEPGVLVRLLDLNGDELHTEHRLSGRIVEPSVVADGAATVEIRALVRPAVGGIWTWAVGGWGDLSLSVGGQELLSGTFPVDSDDPTRVHVAPPLHPARAELVAGEEVEVVARRSLAPGSGVATVLAAAPPVGDAACALAEAVAAARAADVAVVVVGTTEQSESEGHDRATLELPDGQDALVRAVARANPRTAVVVNSGGPVALPWHTRVPALLLAWFPGQEAGGGIADVLFGRAEPGGRLPTTWGTAQDDVPVLDTAPTADGQLRYEEGLHIGYAAWLRSGAVPAYWFGHGLGYTTWTYEELAAPAEVRDGEPFDVRVRVRNSGRRRGREVVQVYLARSGTTVERPARRLIGYAAVEAEPGESVDAVVRVSGRALAHWSATRHGWETETGDFALLGGRSAGDLPLGTTLTAVASRTPAGTDTAGDSDRPGERSPLVL